MPLTCRRSVGERVATPLHARFRIRAEWSHKRTMNLNVRCTTSGRPVQFLDKGATGYGDASNLSHSQHGHLCHTLASTPPWYTPQLCPAVLANVGPSWPVGGSKRTETARGTLRVSRRIPPLCQTAGGREGPSYSGARGRGVTMWPPGAEGGCARCGAHTQEICLFPDDAQLSDVTGARLSVLPHSSGRNLRRQTVWSERERERAHLMDGAGATVA